MMKVDDDISGILLSEQVLNDILSKKYGKRVIRVETDREGFRISFDQGEDINAIILGPEDLNGILEKHYGKRILDIDTTTHEEYLIRFHV